MSSDLMPPARLEQARSALASGNRVRSLRAELWKDWKKAGRSAAALDAAEMIVDQPAYLGTLAVEEFVGRVPTIGRVREARAARHRQGNRLVKILHTEGIRLGTPIRELTHRQRHQLAAFLLLYADPKAWSAHLLEQRKR